MLSRKNFSLTNTQLGEMINPLFLSNGINMTIATSGSTGIAVADNDNINFGTGNFTLVWKGSLPDWTSAASKEIFFRLKGSWYSLFAQVLSVGTVQISIGDGTSLKNYYSTTTIGLVDNNTGEICVSCDRKGNVFF